MIEAISCGGIVIHRGKILLLYKNQNGKYVGWVLPRGTVENGETFKQTALREVQEEAGVVAKISKYIGKTQYTFRGTDDVVFKTIHWYLMTAESFYCKPQVEEYFSDAGYYKKHEAYHLLKFQAEKEIMNQAVHDYEELKSKREWNNNRANR